MHNVVNSAATGSLAVPTEGTSLVVQRADELRRSASFQIAAFRPVSPIASRAFDCVLVRR